MAEVQADYYEEMFKEITKKFYYGDDDDDVIETAEDNMAKNEHILDGDEFKVGKNRTVVAFNDNDDDASSLALPNGFESSTTDVADAQLSKFTLDEENWICSEDTIPWTTSKIASYSATQKLFRCNECECIGFLSRIAEHWLGSHANLRVFQCSQCPYASAWARCVKMHLARQHNVGLEPNSEEEFQKLLKVNPVLDEVTKYLEKLKSKLESTEDDGGGGGVGVDEVKLETNDDELITAADNSTQILETGIPSEMFALASIKRYNCEHCSYATDRKDLFTRHENIHREDKPFQCNVCQKQFNRADHIKKHFIRMHRDHEYVLSNVRRAKTQNRGANSSSSTLLISKPKEKSILAVAASSINQQDIILQESAIQTIIQKQMVPVISCTQESPAQIIVQDTNVATVIQTTQMQEYLQQTDNEPMDISFFGTHTLLLPSDVKSGKIKTSRMKKYNIEKNVQCSYCTWTGADNWCLKRHLNTHLKPYACSLCEYKAARSERLTTHIFRVHNKRACTKCSFLADDMVLLLAHQQENHKGMKSRKKLTSPSETIGTTTKSTTVTSTSIAAVLQ